MDIKIYAFPRDVYGEGYDLSDPEELCRIKCDAGDYLKKWEFALIKLGFYLGNDSNLVAIRDDAHGTIYYHECGWSGEITKHATLNGLREYLKKYDIPLVGKLKWRAR